MFIVAALVGNLSFSLACLILGVHLVRLARRTRQLPEMLIGVSFFIGGFTGHTLTWLMYALKPQGIRLTILLYVIHIVAATASVLLLVLAWRVFRPNSYWAPLSIGAIFTVLLTYVFRDPILGPQTYGALLRNPLYWTHTWALTSPYLWITWESARYQAQLRRRRAIGLPADMMVANRMRFWAIGMGAIGLMLPGVEVFRLVSYLTGRTISPALLISGMGLICSICLWLAFFPPAWCLRLLQEEEAVAA